MASEITTRDVLEEALKHARRQVETQVAGIARASEKAARSLDAFRSATNAKERRYHSGRRRQAEQNLRLCTSAHAYAERVAAALEAAHADPEWSFDDASIDVVDGVRDLLTFLESNATTPRAERQLATMLGARARLTEREAEQEVAFREAVRAACLWLLSTRRRAG
jgi:hypothetical protein